MMAGNIIDSLVVKLTLDQAEYKKGQREATEAFDKTKTAARSAAIDIERSGKSSAESIKGLTREVMTLFAVFTAGRGIKEFAQDVTRADNALGKMAYTLKMTPESVSAWGQAIQRLGGSGDSASRSFQNFSRSIQELKTTGNTGMLPWLYKLQAAGGQTINLGKGLNEIFIDLSKNISAVAKRDPAMANFLGSQLGLDPDTIQLMMKGPSAVRKALRDSEGVTRKQTEEAAKLIESFARLTQKSKSFGRTILTELSPAIRKITDGTTEWTAANEKWMKSEIVGGVKTLNSFLTRTVELLSQAVDLINKFGKETGLTWLLGRFMGLKDEQIDGGRPSYGTDKSKNSWWWKTDRAAKRLLRGGGASVGDAARRGKGQFADGAAPDPEGAGKYRPTYKLGDRDVSDAVVNTIAGEASYKRPGAVDAVINNMLNRVGSKGWGPSRDLQDVARAPGQYEGYKRASPEEAAYIRARIRAIASGGVPDNTNGSNSFRASSYHGPWMQRYGRNGVNVGGNVFAFQPGVANGPYAPYPAGSAPHTGQVPADLRGKKGAPLPGAGGGNSPFGGLVPRGNFGAPWAGGLSPVAPITNNRSNTTQVGTITINTMATDASGIARDMGEALHENSYATMANTGAD